MYFFDIQVHFRQNLIKAWLSLPCPYILYNYPPPPQATTCLHPCHMQIMGAHSHTTLHTEITARFNYRIRCIWRTNDHSLPNLGSLGCLNSFLECLFNRSCSTRPTCRQENIKYHTIRVHFRIYLRGGNCLASSKLQGWYTNPRGATPYWR